MKTTILSLILVPVLCGVTAGAMATSGEAQFLGVITSGTCDIHVEINGVRTNFVNFGTAPTGTTPVDMVFRSFKLMPDMNSPSCAGLNASDRVNTTWSTASFSPVQVDTGSHLDTYPGIRGEGKASEAFVLLNGRRTGGFTLIGDTTFTVSNSGDWLSSGSGFDYEAYFFPGTVPGDFHAAAAWVVSYE